MTLSIKCLNSNKIVLIAKELNMEKQKTVLPLRQSGVLLHPTSFPSKYGIGDLGSYAYDFIDFLEASGQSLWQILPLGHTGYGDSPYQAFSAFAGQPLLISPQKLIEQGLLADEDFRDMPVWDSLKIDYGPVIEYKLSILNKAFNSFQLQPEHPLQKDFESYCKNEDFWLDDYALFMAVKDEHNGKIWTEWAEEIAFPDSETKQKWALRLKNKISFYQFIQFIFSIQWNSLKQYANSKQIFIIGDIPIFVSYDSSDVWAAKELFLLDSKGYPTFVAGVPPDYFSEIGQLWGNPLYSWDYHLQENFKWWIQRISYGLKYTDYLRIDHFRGFEACWAIPFGSPNAINGSWTKGPDKELFKALKAALGNNLPIIAEDLGIITDSVRELRDYFDLPGMKILQFAFENLEDNDYLPHHHCYNSICYSGTHDNDTSLGWYLNASPKSQDKFRRYFNTDGNCVSWDFVRACFASSSKMAIVPLQDILSQDSNFRMNTPGTTCNNWQYRYLPEMLSESLSKRLFEISVLYGRTKALDNSNISN